MLWQILVQFLFRLALGLAVAMGCTSPRWVTSGFYRVHLWVAMGLSTFAAVTVGLSPDFPQRPAVLSVAIAAAVLSYVGSVCWLYEQPRAGQVSLWLVASANLVAAWLADAEPVSLGAGTLGTFADIISSGLVLGTTFAAMLLGHWYLNTPTMKLLPLQRLVLFMAGAVLVRAAFAAWAASGAFSPSGAIDGARWALIALRWLPGLAGVLGLAAMTWQTLKIPNTQSATGILYVAVIFVFLGELTAQLLAVHLPSLV